MPASILWINRACLNIDIWSTDSTRILEAISQSSLILGSEKKMKKKVSHQTQTSKPPSSFLVRCSCEAKRSCPCFSSHLNHTFLSCKKPVESMEQAPANCESNPSPQAPWGFLHGLSASHAYACALAKTSKVIWTFLPHCWSAIFLRWIVTVNRFVAQLLVQKGPHPSVILRPAMPAAVQSLQLLSHHQSPKNRLKPGWNQNNWELLRTTKNYWEQLTCWESKHLAQASASRRQLLLQLITSPKRMKCSMNMTRWIKK